MRYSEFKIINEGFWDSFTDAVISRNNTGSNTQTQQAFTLFSSELIRNFNFSLQQAITTETVDPASTVILDINTGKSRGSIGSVTGSKLSISQFAKNYFLTKFKPNFDPQEYKTFFTACNNLQTNYATTKGKKELNMISNLIWQGQSKPSNTPEPNDSPYPTTDIRGLEAKVGTNLVKFNFSVRNKTWTDQSGRPVVDAKSIKALNDLSKSNKTKLALKTPFPTKNLTLNTTTGKYIFFRGKWYKERIATANLENDNDIIDQLNKLARP